MRRRMRKIKPQETKEREQRKHSLPAKRELSVGKTES